MGCDMRKARILTLSPWNMEEKELPLFKSLPKFEALEKCFTCTGYFKREILQNLLSSLARINSMHADYSRHHHNGHDLQAAWAALKLALAHLRAAMTAKTRR
jgi:hypothetical protein